MVLVILSEFQVFNFKCNFSESAMGVKLTKINELDEYRNQITLISKIFIERWYRPWCIFNWSNKLFGSGHVEEFLIDQAHNFTGNIISTRRKNADFNDLKEIDINLNVDDVYYNKKKRFAMLDTLLKAEAEECSIDNVGIQEEVDTFIFEGFDTTMTAITFTLFMIANHEHMQQRIYEEIMSNDNDADLKYLNAFIKETLRLFPPVPIIGRVLGEPTEIGIFIISFIYSFDSTKQSHGKNVITFHFCR